MLHRIQRALSRTLARQMVFALTLFLSITLSLFSWEMMRRQQVRQAPADLFDLGVFAALQQRRRRRRGRQGCRGCPFGQESHGRGRRFA